MLYDEKAARDSLRNRDGSRVFYLGKEDRLTPAARDFLNREGIQILPASQAAKEEYRILSGGCAREKPEHMTHLNGEVLVPKTHRRIVFRGKMDTMEGTLLLCQLHLRQDLRQKVQEILDRGRILIRCDVLNQPVEEFTLCDLGEEEQRQRSHFPQKYFGQPHFMPDVRDEEQILWLNLARCAVREAELAACDAFADRDGRPTRPDIVKALNRMSSMLYILMLQEKGRINGDGKSGPAGAGTALY